MINEMESKMIPKGRIDLIGLGRLGLRTGINLIQVHRGGPKEMVLLMDRRFQVQILFSHYLVQKKTNIKLTF